MFLRILELFIIFAAVAGASQEKKAINCAGEITDEKGVPVEGALVEIHELIVYNPNAMNGACIIASATSREDGGYSINIDEVKERLFDAGFVITCRKKGYALGWKFLQSKGLLGDELTITMGKPYEIRGRVFDQHGAPIKGANVRACLQKPGRFDVRSFYVAIGSLDYWNVRTDKKGSFIFDNLPSETSAALFVRAEGYADYESDLANAWQSRRLPRKVKSHDETIKLTEESLLEGTVVGAQNGKVTVGIELVAMPAQPNLLIFPRKRAICDDKGVFTLHGLNRGSWIVRHISFLGEGNEFYKGHLITSLDSGERKKVTLTLEKVDGIEVTVIEEASGKPIENALAVVKSGQIVGELMLASDVSGKLVVPLSRDDKATIVVLKDGFEGPPMPGFSYEPGSSPVVIRMKKT